MFKILFSASILSLAAGIFPVKLNPDDWTSGDIVWLLDVIAKMVSITRWFFVGLLLTALTACYSSESGIEEQVPDDFISEELNWPYWRSKTVFKVKKTGELIEFDIVQNVANREPISEYFDGPKVPMVMFKATSDGGAISIDTNKDYYGYGIKETPRYRVVNPIPMTMWYPDVNDLSFGLRYVTSQAFRSPHARLEFVSHEISSASKADFNAWTEKTIEEYEQIGAIPGPFGCKDSGTNGKHPNSCFSKKNMNRNNGRVIATSVGLSFLRPRFAIKGKLSEKSISSARDFIAAEQQYVCFSAGAWSNDKKMGYLAALLRGVDESNGVDPTNNKQGLPSVFGEFYSDITRSTETGVGKAARDDRYELDANVAMGLTEQKELAGKQFGSEKQTHFSPISDVLPVVKRGIVDIDVTVYELITDPDWRGFAIAGQNDDWVNQNISKISTDKNWNSQFNFEVDGAVICETFEATTRILIFDTKVGSILRFRGPYSE